MSVLGRSLTRSTNSRSRQLGLLSLAGRNPFIHNRARGSTGIERTRTSRFGPVSRLSPISTRPRYLCLIFGLVCPGSITETDWLAFMPREADMFGLEVTINELETHKAVCSPAKGGHPVCHEWRSFSYSGYLPSTDRWAIHELPVSNEATSLGTYSSGMRQTTMFTKLYDMPNLKSCRFSSTLFLRRRLYHRSPNSP